MTEILSGVFILAGTIFILLSALGIIRMPDLYTRMSATTKASTLGIGLVLTGTVRNVIDFGAFVDISVHQDGLVHISELASKFIRHPSDVVSVGDVVKVLVLSVDKQKKRIALSLKQAK